MSKEINANWQSIFFVTGFNLSDLVKSVLQFADTPERTEAIQKVITLLESGGQDIKELRQASNHLYDLSAAHPDREQSSGGWLSGSSASYMALATAMAAGDCARHRIGAAIFDGPDCPIGKTEYEHAEGDAFKTFKYLHRAFQLSQPEDSPIRHYFKWLDRQLELKW